MTEHATERAISTERSKRLLSSARSAASTPRPWRTSWTPRMTHLLVRSPTPTSGGEETVWARPKSHKVWDFAPTLSGPYQPPPPPRSIKRYKETQDHKERLEVSDELRKDADNLRSEADLLDKAAEDEKKRMVTLGIQVGLLLVKEDAASSTPGEGVKKLLGASQWDVGPKGLTKPEFRLKLRELVREATSADCDALFETLDADGGGSLDYEELREALLGLQHQAEAWKELGKSPKAVLLRQRAQVADAAATATEQAEQAEQAVQEMTRKNLDDAAIQLGMILFKRGIKPGAVVTTWSTSRGEHAGELSKKEFREAVQALGLSRLSGKEIDAVFDTFDGDAGGYLDVDEAKQMIKQLRKVAEDAEHELMKKTMEGHRARKLAFRKIALAHEPLPDPPPAASTLEATNFTASSTARLARGSKSPTPERKRLGRKSRDSKEPGPVLAESAIASVDVSVEASAPAPAPATAGFLGMSFLAAEAVTNVEPSDDAQLQLLRSIQKLELARSWRMWREMLSQRLKDLQLQRSVMLGHFLPRLMRGYVEWKDFCERRERARCLVLKSIQWWANHSSGRAFLTWRDLAEQHRARLHSSEENEGDLCTALGRIVRDWVGADGS